MAPEILHSRLLNTATTFPSIRSCVFDLEATLFWSHRFEAETYERAVECVSSALNLTSAEAKPLIQARRSELTNALGYKPALSTTLCTFGITLEQWGEHQGKVSVASTIDVDRELIPQFSDLSRCSDIIIYTNMCSSLARQALVHLGLIPYVRTVLTPQILNATKPSTAAIRKLVSDGLFDPETTVSIGDRYYLDIQPIVEAGGYGYLVGSRTELYDFLHLILSQNGASK